MIAFRPAVRADRGRIEKPWLSAFERSHNAGLLPARLFYPAYREVLGDLLARDSVRVTIAHAEGEPDRVLGFACVESGPFTLADRDRTVLEHPAVHFVYVTAPYRRQGVCRALLAKAGVDVTRPVLVTFRTADGAGVAKRLRMSAAFEPRLIRLAEPTNTTRKEAA